MEDTRFRWVLVTAIAPIAWGSTYFVTGQFLPHDAPWWGAALRAAPAAVILLLITRRLPHGVWWWRAAVLGALNVVGLFVLVYVAGVLLPSSVAATVMSLSAAVMLLMSWMILRVRARGIAIVGSVIGITGVAIMVGFNAQDLNLWGVVASIGGMVSSSLGFVLTARWAGGVRMLDVTSWQLAAGAIMLLVIAGIVEGAPPALTAQEMLGFGYLSVVATALAFVAWFTGIQHLGPGVVGVIGLLNPVTGVLLGVLLAGEVFGVKEAVGVALVVAGIVLGARPARKVRAERMLT